MLNFGNKEFRNIQEQVAKNQCDIEKLSFGLNIVGKVDSVENLPDANEGDAYLVGTTAPYYIYVKVDDNYTNIGTLASNVPGPKGDKGDQGMPGQRGTLFDSGSEDPTPYAEDYRDGDLYLNYTTGMIFKYDTQRWLPERSIRGPQGTQGPRGPRNDIVLGTTAGTAYEGNAGQANADAIANLQTDAIALEDHVDALAIEVANNTQSIADNTKTLTAYKDSKENVETSIFTYAPSAITDIETFYKAFYDYRKDSTRHYLIEGGTEQSITNQSIITALGGFPEGFTHKQHWALSVNMPIDYSGGFYLDVQLQGSVGDDVYKRIIKAWNGAGVYATPWESHKLNATKADVDAKIAKLVDTAPGTLDTLNEIAKALGDDPNFAATMTKELATKATTTYVNEELALKQDKLSTVDLDNIAMINQYADDIGVLKTTKVDKIKGDNILYGTDRNGAPTSLTYDKYPNINTVVQRTNFGCVKCADPINADEATNKRYVDSKTELVFSGFMPGPAKPTDDPNIKAKLAKAKAIVISYLMQDHPTSYSTTFAILRGSDEVSGNIDGYCVNAYRYLIKYEDNGDVYFKDNVIKTNLETGVKTTLAVTGVTWLKILAIY